MNSFRLFLFCPASTFASSSSHSCDATNILYTHIFIHMYAQHTHTRIAHTHERKNNSTGLSPRVKPTVVFPLLPRLYVSSRAFFASILCLAAYTPLPVPFMTDLTNLENHISRNVYQNPETSTLDTIAAMVRPWWRNCGKGVYIDSSRNRMNRRRWTET